MSNPRILVFAGSIRTGSFNASLAALAAKELALAGADVTHISLQDFPMPIYDGDLEASSGAPDNAIKLKRMMMTHAGVFIASPEYNASVTPLLKNTLDWISRVRDGKETPLAAYKNRIFALGSASNGAFGGMRSLLALRQVLEIGAGALVLPEQISVSRAADAYDDMGHLKDERTADLLRVVVRRLIDMARQFS